MKKGILVAIISLIGLNVLNAQTFSQGEKAISTRVSGLNLNFNKVEGQDSEVNFNLGLKGDYFLIDNLTLTAGFDYAYQNKDNSFQGEIGFKYYFWNYLYGGAFYQGLYDYKRINSSGKVEFGATYYIADNVFIEPAIYFQAGEKALGVDFTKSYTQFGLAISFGVNF
ncbi:hypothetical protein AGMMS50262_03400 [Bacteroidia bacterium]|nr:hypothetical protein AGMMS50262_03400 [Bacteroidia bacterium]